MFFYQSICRKVFLLIIYIVFQMQVQAAKSSEAEMFKFTENGKSDYTIIIPSKSTKAEQFASEELSSFLKKITGASIPVKTDEFPSCEQEIVLGKTNRMALKDIPATLRPSVPEGYTILRKNKKLFIIGKIPRATLYGVYDLLEELGVRFLTAKATHIPCKNSLSCVIVSRKYDPPLEYRNIYSYWPPALERKWGARNKLNAMWVAPPMRMVLGGCEYIGGFVHNLPKLLPHKKYFAKHPEYFALIEGKRRRKMFPAGNFPSHPCLTNKAVKKIIITNIRKIIANYKNHPNLYHPDSLIVFPIDYTDHGQVCQCSECQAVNKEERTKGGTLYRLLSAIASELEKDYPNVIFSTLAYSSMINPPAKTKFGKNVSIRYAPIRSDFGRSFDDPKSKPNVKTLHDLKVWSKMTNRLHIWYYATNFNSYITPHPDLRAISRNFKILSEHGMKGMFAESSMYPGSALRELRHYLLAQLMWRPDADAQKIIREFCQLYYGKGAGGVLKYIEYLHNYHFTKVDADGNNPLTAYGAPPYKYAYNAEFIEKADAILGKAEKDAVTEEEKFHVAVARLPIWFLRLEEAMHAEGKATSLPVEWNFKLDRNNVGMKKDWPKKTDFSSWGKIRTDNFWTKQGYNYHGVAWYATPFDLSHALPGDGSFAFSFGAVDGYCDIFVDGKKIGEQKLPPAKMWNQGFHIPIKTRVEAGKHTLVVRVKKGHSAAGIWKRVSVQNLELAVSKEVRTAGVRFLEVSKKIGLDAITTAYGKKGAINKYYGRIRVLLAMKKTKRGSFGNDSVLKSASMLHSCHNTYSLVKDKTALNGYCLKQTAAKKWNMGQAILWNITKHLKEADGNGKSYSLRARIKVAKKGDKGYAFCLGYFYQNKNFTGSWCEPIMWIKAADVENGKWKWYTYPHTLKYKKYPNGQCTGVWAGHNPDNINAIYVDAFELIEKVDKE